MVEKSIQPAECVLTSLLELQKELVQEAIVSGRYSEMLLKVNSCLYSQYPHHLPKKTSNIC